MQQQDINPDIRKLRVPDRIAQLEVPRVVALCVKHGRFSNLLDVGTGSGLFAEAFADRGLQVTGIDPDPLMVAAARSHLSDLICVVGTAEALPFGNDSFEALFMGMVLHETADPQLALIEARRVAKRTLAVLEWPPPAPTDPPPPARRFSRRQVGSMARTAGFSSVSIHSLRQAVVYLLQ